MIRKVTIPKGIPIIIISSFNANVWYLGISVFKTNLLMLLLQEKYEHPPLKGNMGYWHQL